MTILINGEEHVLNRSSLTISDLLTHLSFTQQKGIAVAQNHNLVRRSEWSTTHIQDGDEIEILHATAGG